MKKNVFIIVSLFLSIFCNAQEKIRSDGINEVKNIILMIGDGMGVTQINAAMTSNKEPLNIEKFRTIGFSKTYSADNYITDSGAGGTAIATGYKTYNHAIGVDEDTIARTSILEYAEINGKTTGLVATSTITHATPASFIAHQPSRYMYEEIAEDFMKTEIEVFIGGGLKHFNDRYDGKDLTKELQRNGYAVVYQLDDLNDTENNKIAGLLYKDAPPKISQGRKNMLKISSLKAIETLNKNDSGFFLMIEASQIDWGGHDRDIDYVVKEMIDFDNCIGEVLKFAKEDGNTLVIVTADHETGGLGLTGGDINTGKIHGKFVSDHHTGVMVPVFAYGPGAEYFGGIYQNTDIFTKMMEAFGFINIK